ncbi:MAG TPA: chemotaxis protein CheW [Bacteroidales bacterium]|nr:chemotaxis protein CheW [Bacteroidales bacterium]
MEENEDQITYLTFVLNKELFAVDVSFVLEVLQNVSITEVPKTPEYIKGIANFRGEIIPVVNTFKKFNLNENSVNERNVIVMEVNVNGKQMKIGTTASGVRDVVTFDDKDIVPIPEIGAGYNIQFLQGAVKLDNRFVLVLNVNEIFSHDEIVILSNASES